MVIHYFSRIFIRILPSIPSFQRWEFIRENKKKRTRPRKRSIKKNKEESKNSTKKAIKKARKRPRQKEKTSFFSITFLVEFLFSFFLVLFYKFPDLGSIGHSGDGKAIGVSVHWHSIDQMLLSNSDFKKCPCHPLSGNWVMILEHPG